MGILLVVTENHMKLAHKNLTKLHKKKRGSKKKK